MKRVWKPIDVGGYRLYDVILYVRIKGALKENRTHYTVAANSPTHAASLIADIHKESLDERKDIAYWHTKGFALNILQPADWWESGVPDGYCERCHKWSLRVVNNELICSNENRL